MTITKESLIRETLLAHFKILDVVLEKQFRGKFDENFEWLVHETRKKLISIFETHYAIEEYRVVSGKHGKPLVEPVYREDATDVKNSIARIVDTEINAYLHEKQNSKKKE